MTRTLLKSVLLVSGAAVLIAASPKADLNQDGQVTQAEFTQSAESRFFATDANSDGFLSQEERKAHRAAERENRKNQRFTKLDTNGDGLLSRDEVDAADKMKKARHEGRRQKMMEKFDTNVDGTLSDAERLVMKSEFGKKRDRIKGKRGEKRSERPKMDANDDGLISLDEYITVSEQLFTRLDANSDGVLTEGEGRKRKGKRSFKRRG